jgi:hypothetical protein
VRENQTMTLTGLESGIPDKRREMRRKPLLHTAALIGVGLLTSSLSFAQPSVATTKTYSAIVGSQGLLRVGPEGSSSTHLGTGVYEVDFPTDVSACVYTATIGISSATAQIGPAVVTLTPVLASPMAST